MFENIKIGKGKPEKGKLLLSEPFMFDSNFKRTVILLTEHNEEGTVGFILNRKIKMTIHDSIEDFPEFDASVYLGGPVQPDTLHYIHKAGDLLEDSVELVPGVYWGGNFEVLKILIDKEQVNPSDFRFFIGYSGWSPGQLENELKEKSWIIAPGTIENIFDTDADNLWKDVLEDMGKEYGIMANFPEDPNLN